MTLSDHHSIKNLFSDSGSSLTIFSHSMGSVTCRQSLFSLSYLYQCLLQNTQICTVSCSLVLLCSYLIHSIQFPFVHGSSCKSYGPPSLSNLNIRIDAMRYLLQGTWDIFTIKHEKNQVLRTLDDIRTIVLEGWHSYEMETAVQMFRKEGVFAGVK